MDFGIQFLKDAGLIRSKVTCNTCGRDMKWCAVKGQWVFGGVERESGRTFLVPVPDRIANTLIAAIAARIEHGTTVISDCWGAYRELDTHGYTHHTVNHSIEFVDQRPGAQTNSIESTWRHVKAYLSP